MANFEFINQAKPNNCTRGPPTWDSDIKSSF
ncbi:hypothetical protein RSAG8_13479, partial [Rhizoctonia solani AG-8 WAC10335]